MLNKLLSLLFLTCINISAYAYIIGTNVSITNNTNIPLTIHINAINLQPSITQILPAHKTSVVYLENGDDSGWLYQAAATPFEITSTDNKTYVKGRMIFYVGGSLWRKYSFPDAITYADGLHI